MPYNKWLSVQDVEAILMKMKMSRRSLLASTASVAAGSMLGQMLPVARAGEVSQSQNQAGGICMSMIFENGKDVKFDTKKYVKNHLPLLRDVYGDSVERIELSALDIEKEDISSLVAIAAGRFTVRASTTFWIRDVPAFGQKLATNAARINADLDSITKGGNRLVQFNRVVLELGDARREIKADSEVLSTYYLPKDASGDPAFDQRYFVETYLPALYSKMGPEAISRIEATMGLEQGGRKPAQVAAFHAYIRNRTILQARARNAPGEMQKDAEKIAQNAVPLFFNMRVTGVA
jgi:hypothetical protein